MPEPNHGRCKEAETRAVQVVGGMNTGTMDATLAHAGDTGQDLRGAPGPRGEEKHPSLLRLELPPCFARRQV